MAQAPPFPVEFDAPLAPYTTLGLGGPARGLAMAHNEAEMQAILRWAKNEGWPVLLLGGGSNLVIGDVGFSGLAVQVGLRGRRLEPGGAVWAAAGEHWDDLVEATVAAGLSGFECLSGIPGSVGATPIQNVGAYGREVGELICAVRVWDRESDRIESLDPAACGFAYRDSRFRRSPDRWVVLDIEFQLEPGGRPLIRYPELARALEGHAITPRAVREAVLAIRRRKSMVIDAEDANRRSAGSFFKNPIVPEAKADEVAAIARSAGLIESPSALPRYDAVPGHKKLSAAWLIERSGISKGLRRGSVGVSTRHTLALVHLGEGRTEDLLALAAEVRDAVWGRFLVQLEPEPTLVGCALPPRA